MNIHIFIVTLYAKHFFLSGLTKGQMFEIKNGKINTTNPSVWVHDVSLGGCLDECKFRISCTALNYHQFVNLCQLDITPSPEVVPTKERGLLCWIKTTQEDHVECGQHSCKIGFVCNIRQKTYEKKECSPLSIPSNTIILGNVNAIGAKIKMRCKEGYFATGPETITLTCGVNGAWSPQPLICKTASVGSACTANNECLDTTTMFCDTSGIASSQCRKKVGQSCVRVSDCPNNGECPSNTCECASGFVQDGELCKATVGSACDANDDCLQTSATFCDKSAAGSQCRKKVGQPCATDSECPNNGKCFSSSCACASGFEQEGELCKATVGSACTANDDCADTTTTFCDPSAAGGQCRKKVGQTCTTESDCPYNGECPSSTCECKFGFEQKGDFCNGRLISQWVESVVNVSSEYSSTKWSASQIVGEPDRKSWSSSYANNPEFIEVSFPNTVRVTAVEIYKTFGTVNTEIKCFQDGAYQSLYDGEAVGRVARLSLPALERPCISNQLRIEVFTGVTLSGNWMAIDAIRLNGTLV